MLRLRLLAWQKNSSIIDDFEQVGSGVSFLHECVGRQICANKNGI